MALVCTDPEHTTCDLRLRMAIADELSAQKLYTELIKHVLRDATIPEYIQQDIIARLTEILKDEEEHLGSLLQCIDLLNPKFTENMRAGISGA